MSRLVIFGLFSALHMAAVEAAFAFETYRVSGVSVTDTLTLREEPSDGEKPTNWREVGKIPSDAINVFGTGRSKLVGDQRWLEVSFGKAHGWANAKFLEIMEAADLKSETFNCSGTEPFWGVTLGPSKGEFSDPESKTSLTTERVQPAVARLFPLLYRLTDANGRKYRATISRQSWCSDGMSEYDYSFQVLFSSEEEFHEGCCVLHR